MVGLYDEGDWYLASQKWKDFLAQLRKGPAL
jgi:hypothetical protein